MLDPISCKNLHQQTFRTLFLYSFIYLFIYSNIYLQTVNFEEIVPILRAT